MTQEGDVKLFDRVKTQRYNDKRKAQEQDDGKGAGQDSMRLTAADGHIVLSLPRQFTRHIGFELMAFQASAASRNDLIGKEVFLRHPPLPFDYNYQGGVRSRNHETDEDWLPELSDIISGNFHVMIDMTGESDSEVCHCLHTTRTITRH